MLPGVLCATPSTLLYVDESKNEIHWLDLSDAKPKPAAGKCTIDIESKIRDVCVVKDGDKELLIVVVDEVNGVFAYNTETGKLEWKVDVAAPRIKYGMCPVGITTDGRGHLFVTDENNEFIHMFSASDGLYITDLKITGNPQAIRWCKKSSSLVLNVIEKGKFHLNVINVQVR